MGSQKGVTAKVHCLYHIKACITSTLCSFLNIRCQFLTDLTKYYVSFIVYKCLITNRNRPDNWLNLFLIISLAPHLQRSLVSYSRTCTWHWSCSHSWAPAGFFLVWAMRGSEERKSPVNSQGRAPMGI